MSFVYLIGPIDAASPVKIGVSTNPKKCEYQPFHPDVPHHLHSTKIRDMSWGERLDYWACFELPPPPSCFDDWYIIGSEKSGVLGAVPVIDYVHGEPK